MSARQVIEELFGPEHGWVSPWIESLPDAYFQTFVARLAEWYPNVYRVDTEAGRRETQNQTFVRLSQANDLFRPWVEEKLSLKGKRVLEIGSGSGSSTAALLFAGADVLGLEIDARAVEYAQLRCELLATPKAPRFGSIAGDWLSEDDAFDWDGMQRDFAPNTVVCYALLEHLTPPERLVLLYNAMRILPIDGHLITFETPNRLMAHDWHSSKLLFSEVLPDWLLRRYLTVSPRMNLPGIARASLSPASEDDTRLYRFGRGASFHEFLLAVGLENIDVIHDGYSARILRAPNRRPVPDYETALKRVLVEHAPPIHQGFARPSLDLIIRKSGEPRRFDLPTRA